jgi:RNA polymerase sigma-70 factor (ECF subfamily)
MHPALQPQGAFGRPPQVPHYGGSPFTESVPGPASHFAESRQVGVSGWAASDEELISAVLAGHDRVTTELYSRLVGVIDKSLYRVFGRREADHDDLVQTTFEQVVLTLTRGSYARNCSLKTWAARISVNVGLNALRSRRRERRVLDRNAEYPGECAASVDVERQSDARAALQVVMGELADMNPRRAQAVLLHDVQGYDLTEVAAMTDVSVTAAQSRLVRGRRELLKRLDSLQKRTTGAPSRPPARAASSAPETSVTPGPGSEPGFDDGRGAP